MEFTFVPGRVRPSFTIHLLAAHAERGVELPLDALVDTGAEKCFFDAELCEPLGLKLAKGAAEDINNGTSKAYLHEVAYKTDLGHAPIQIRGLFMENLYRTHGHLAILGIIGFLDRFKISMNAKDRVFDLEQV